MLLEYSGVDIHRKEHIVLKDVNFKLGENEFVFLIGRVGSGKSSLIKTIYADVPVENGDAKVLDYDLRTIKRKQIPYLRREIGVVFQDFQLLTDRTVYENLKFVLRATGWKDKKAIDERIDAVLKEVGMLNKSYKMPHELSGGEQQRVVIARALLNKPRILLADEPTGNLDPETALLIVNNLREISKRGTSVIMATHNHAFVKEIPSRVFVCRDKRLIEETPTTGTPDISEDTQITDTNEI